MNQTPQNWKKYRFADLAKPVSEKYDPITNDKNYPCIELEHLAKEDGKLLSFVDSKQQASIKTKFKEKDILFGKLRPYLKKFLLADFIGVCTTEIWALRPNESVCLPEYLFRIVQTHHFIQNANTTSGSKMPRADWDWVSEFALDVPPIDEQEKIAKILSTWDKSVETTERLIAAKQKLKKSLMQRLLTGSQRFPEFRGREWTKYKIADLFEEVARYVKWSDEHSYKLVSIRRRFKGLFPRGDFFGHQIGVKKLKSIHSEDFLISKRQVSHGAWGVVTPEFHDTKVSDEYDSLIVKDKTKINVDFWGWLCKTSQMQRYSYLSSNGVHIEKLIFDFNDFRKRSIYVPSSIEEQKKIAAVLEKCDAEINVLQNKLAALRQQKRGLMQKLLTGETRVKVSENDKAAFED